MAGYYNLDPKEGPLKGVTENELRQKLGGDFEVRKVICDESGKVTEFVVKPLRDETPQLLKDGLEFTAGDKGIGIRFVFRGLEDEEYMKLRSIVGVLALKLEMTIEDPQFDEKGLDPNSWISTKYFDYSTSSTGKTGVDPAFIERLKRLK